MKVIGIIASPHRDGSGAALVREALAGAREAGAEVQEVFLADLRIEYCRDCRTCTGTGRCAVKDDFQELRGQMREADGIILCSPTYGPGMAARMKNLVDRLGQFAFLTSEMGGKYVAGISTAGSFGAKKVAAGLAASVRDSLFRRSRVSGTLAVHLRGNHASAMPTVMAKARGLGGRMARDIRGGRRYPLQNLAGRLPIALFLRPMLKSAIVANRQVLGGVYDELVRTGVVAAAGA